MKALFVKIKHGKWGPLGVAKPEVNKLTAAMWWWVYVLNSGVLILFWEPWRVAEGFKPVTRSNLCFKIITLSSVLSLKDIKNQWGGYYPVDKLLVPEQLKLTVKLCVGSAGVCWERIRN